MPTASVTVTVSGHAGSDVSLDKTSLTFTTSNWNSAQTVTVKAAEDADAADDTVTLTHTAAGAEYDDLTANLDVTVDDDDTAAIVTIYARTRSPSTRATPRVTSYTVKLSYVPTADGHGDRVAATPPATSHSTRPSLTFTDVELEHRPDGDGEGRRRTPTPPMTRSPSSTAHAGAEYEHLRAFRRGHRRQLEYGADGDRHRRLSHVPTAPGDR